MGVVHAMDGLFGEGPIRAACGAQAAVARVDDIRSPGEMTGWAVNVNCPDCIALEDPGSHAEMVERGKKFLAELEEKR